MSTGTWLDVPHLFEYVPIDRIADFYAREITEGIDGTGIKGRPSSSAPATRAAVTPGQERVLRAAARASMRTSAPIMTHTWAPERIGEQQADVFEYEGVDPDRVCIGHSNDTTDLGYLIGLLRRGFWLGMDRHKESGLMGPTWQERVRRAQAAVRRRMGTPHHDRPRLGLDGRTLLSGDQNGARRSEPRSLAVHRAQGAPDAEVTRHERGSDIRKLTVDNPRRYFEGRS